MQGTPYPRAETQDEAIFGIEVSSCMAATPERHKEYLSNNKTTTATP
jgi:hypothetical protein